MAYSTDIQTACQLPLSLDTLLNSHLYALNVKGYSPYTVRNRLVHIRMFVRWCRHNGIITLPEITPTVLQQYQQHLFEYRKRNGEPLTVTSRHARLVPLRVWFRWMARKGHVARNVVDDIELPRLGHPLPRNILSAAEVRRVLSQPDHTKAVGLRDRSILEVLYSTGIRRLELVNLKLYDVHFDRKLIFVCQGKGKRDRYVPLGRTAREWLRTYIREARPLLVRSSEETTVFLTVRGNPLSRDHVTWIARRYITSAKIGKTGACHLFRHSMATLMHENGADIRYIQQMLGHADIKTTQIYTQVAIRALQRVHSATHPAA